ncbi:hypothetical protein SK128_008165 [Halocaridina rubra]|uniref:Uncharacterized protein n=1 Tax=Halocaridina rubra TaxID=373956 RepID=A0AAN8WUM2_HALRR
MLRPVMGDDESEPSANESGIRRFIRGILPNWPLSSPQGGTLLTQNETRYTGNDESSSGQTLDMKRKSSLLRNNDDSEDSDYEETLPSHKRQRVTVSAMRRLFAKFSLNDKDTTEPSTVSATESYASNVSSDGVRGSDSNIPRDSSESDLPALLPTLTNENSSDTTSLPTINNNVDDIPNMNNKHLSIQKTKRDSTSTEKKQSLSRGKRQKIGQQINSSKNTQCLLQKAANHVSENNNKRHVEITESDNEDNQENSNKAKRTRKLRRGLRLCTNITCYIEQVLYN